MPLPNLRGKFHHKTSRRAKRTKNLHKEILPNDEIPFHPKHEKGPS
jgi:hypothetical protein